MCAGLGGRGSDLVVCLLVFPLKFMEFSGIIPEERHYLLLLSVF